MDMSSAIGKQPNADTRILRRGQVFYESLELDRLGAACLLAVRPRVSGELLRHSGGMDCDSCQWLDSKHMTYHKSDVAQ